MTDTGSHRQTADDVAREQERLSKDYLGQADGLGMIAESGHLGRLAPHFNDYPRYLKRRGRKISSEHLVREFSGGDNVIEIADASPRLRELLYTAHIAVCCELFQNLTFPAAGITRAGMQKLGQDLVSRYTTSGTVATGIHRLHQADAIRTMQILRLLGLVKISTRAIRQLSFACGNATRELYGMHKVPNMKRVTGKEEMRFRVEQGQPGHVVLIDNDSEFSDHFAMLNAQHPDWIHAMSRDLDASLAELREKTRDPGFGLRNLVAGLRIDHLMFPDVPAFFSQLAPLLEPSADLVITVGAGHSLEEFKGRIATIAEMFGYLEDRGLEPVRIKLYLGDTPEQQRKHPGFGHAAVTTYDILYCRIRRAALPG